MTLDEFRKLYASEVEQQNAAIQRRQDNMFLGPIGIEERLDIMRGQLNFAHWAIIQLTEALATERARSGESDGCE
jgi:hypothetical protein